jgi:hypothetical protein
MLGSGPAIFHHTAFLNCSCLGKSFKAGQNGQDAMRHIHGNAAEHSPQIAWPSILQPGERAFTCSNVAQDKLEHHSRPDAALDGLGWLRRGQMSRQCGPGCVQCPFDGIVVTWGQDDRDSSLQFPVAFYTWPAVRTKHHSSGRKFSTTHKSRLGWQHVPNMP